MSILETERLYLREITVEDAEQAYLLNSDVEVIKYTGDSSFESIEEAKQFLEKYEHYQKYGFGRWAVILKSNDEFLGWCGLKYDEALNEYDIGFRFFKKHWNKGYATEAAKACIQLGFEKFKMPVILGRVMKENFASQRVLEKLGLQYYKNGTCGGEESLIYKIEKPSFKY